jgi:hypothetical protein
MPASAHVLSCTKNNCSSAYDYLFGDDNDLAPVCTTGCTSAMVSYRADVVKNCGSYTVVDTFNSTYAPTYVIDSIKASYDLQCLYNSDAKTYCSPIINAYETPNGLLSLPNSQLCTFCTLATLNITVSNPSTFSYPVMDLLNTAIQQCGP